MPLSKKETDFVVASVREIFWNALVWDGRNYSAQMPIRKARMLTKDFGISDINEANRYVENLERSLSGSRGKTRNSRVD